MLNRLRSIAFPLTAFWPWLGRSLITVAFAAVFLFALTVMLVRYWVLPEVPRYRQEIAASLSQATGQPISIGQIDVDWAGLRPRLTLQDVILHDRQNQPVLLLRHVEGVISWLSVLTAELRLQSLTLDAPVLDVQRDEAGLIYVAGIVVNKPGGDSRFVRWILQQRRITVRNAVVRWQDNKAKAPLLELQKVHLALLNSGSRHRFGLRAVPPSSLATPLDIRGDIQGSGLQSIEGWRGTLFSEIGKLEFSNLRQYLPLPADIREGNGGVRLWLSFQGGQATEVTADVRLNNVSSRLAADLPELDVESLTGRLGWRKRGKGFEVYGRPIALNVRGVAALAPATLSFRWLPAEEGKAAEGAIALDRVDVGKLLRLSDYLPLPMEARRELQALSPRGRFDEFALNWQGSWKTPVHYKIKGHFVGLGFNAYGRLPGINGVSGNVDGNEKGGNFSLNSHLTRLDMPMVFREPLSLDALTAQIAWKKKQGEMELKLANISFTNADLAGSAYGNYVVAGDGPGRIDLNANLVRADARKVSRYIPLVVADDARAWLDRAFLAGTSDDVRLRLKGNLSDFPFMDSKKGVFQVTAKFKGGTLDYAPDWPKIENIEGNLAFRGKGMDIDARQGTIFGVRLAKIHASIADLFTGGKEILELHGEAQGSTADTLRFINESPVYKRVEGFTDGLKANGNGALSLKLTMPLHRIDDTRVQGSYQFLNNRISGNGLPTLERVNGVLEFSDSGVKMENVSAHIFGGPARINAASTAGGLVKVDVRGKLTAAGLHKVLPASIADRLHGETDWRARADVRRQNADLTVDSTLAGLGIELPAPFAKRSRDVLPLSFVKKTTGEKQDRISVTIGKLFSAQLQRQSQNGEMQVKRGTIGINKAAPQPGLPGIWMSGALEYLDLDQWLDVMGGKGTDMAGTGAALAGVDLSAAKVIWLNREFHGITIGGRLVSSSWQAKLTGKEVGGSFTWEGGARKKLSARLKYLIVPPSITTLKSPSQAPAEVSELPSLDVICESLEMGKRKLGRLELLASPRTGDWRIDRFHLTNSDFGLRGNGAWLNWRGQSRTSMNLQLDVQNVGRFLGSFGFPGAVKGGEASLSGRLAWEGGPGEIGYSSLTGNLALEARNGQFLKVDPGIGKLLGIISLQALPRRISLDFRDVFSDGFAFDKISASMGVNHGIVSSDDFTMVGPAALVSMSGQTDLAKETQNLQVKVVPAFSDSVSVAGAFLGGPAVGIASLIIQKMLKDPVGQITAYRYAITGNWADPIVSKIDRHAQQPGANLEGGSP